MSKPLATKVSTPLSENVQIGPKVSIFCVATIIFHHCLNSLGHGVHQSFTGCHWSPLPLLHDDITELVDVRDLALLHLPFRMPTDAQWGLGLETCLSSPSPLPSASWRCVWGRYHVEYCPAAQSPKGGDHALLQYVTVHVGIHGSLNEL